MPQELATDPLGPVLLQAPHDQTEADVGLGPFPQLAWQQMQVQPLLARSGLHRLFAGQQRDHLSLFRFSSYPRL